MTVGENIKKYRKEKGWTQKQLAERLEISEITIRKYEANNIKPKYTTLKCIVEILNIPLSEIDIQIDTPVDKNLEEYKKELAQFLHIKEDECQFAIKYDKYSEVGMNKEYLKGVVSGLNMAFDILERVKNDDKKRKDL